MKNTQFEQVTARLDEQAQMIVTLAGNVALLAVELAEYRESEVGSRAEVESLRAEVARLADLNIKIDAFLESRAKIQALNEGADSEDLARSQFDPKPATGAIGAIV